ncbi:MAG: hypothetical protein V5A79_01560, partial [Candidatus Bipolaricaulota bacterium]
NRFSPLINPNIYFGYSVKNVHVMIIGQKSRTDLPIIAENAPGQALGMNQLVVGPAVNRGYFP